MMTPAGFSNSAIVCRRDVVAGMGQAAVDGPDIHYQQAPWEIEAGRANTVSAGGCPDNVPRVFRVPQRVDAIVLVSPFLAKTFPGQSFLKVPRRCPTLSVNQVDATVRSSDTASFGGCEIPPHFFESLDTPGVVSMENVLKRAYIKTEGIFHGMRKFIVFHRQAL